MYNLQSFGHKLSFQPNKRYKNKIIFCVITAAIAFILPYVWPLTYNLYMLANCIGIVFAMYAVYDFLFRLNLTYVFNRMNRQVYQKIPGLFSRKLMSFEEIHIMPETVNAELHYVIAHKENRYGRNYAISDYFSDTKKGRKEQEEFEIQVLTAIEDLLLTKR